MADNPCASVEAPLLEMTVTRLMQAPREAVWRAFTDHLTEFWCPKPWRVEVIARELRPGGRSEMVMHGPNGEEFPNRGVYLEVVPAERLVFTDAFTAGWRHPLHRPRPALAFRRRRTAPCDGLRGRLEQGRRAMGGGGAADRVRPGHALLPDRSG